MDVGGAANNSDVTLTLADAGWHAIGNPFGLAVNVADLTFSDTSGPKTFDAAVPTWVEGTLYRWNTDPTSGDSYQTVDSADQLDPWEGYWLKTTQPNLTLTIPAPDGLASFVPILPSSFEPPVAAPPIAERSGQEPGGFNLRFALTSDSSSDLTTTLGTRTDAKDGWDALDSSEPPRLSKTVAVYFDHTDRTNAPGMFNTDYRPQLEVGETQTWRIVVSTDAPQEQMLLSWKDAIGQIPDDVMLYFRRADSQLSEVKHDAREASQSSIFSLQSSIEGWQDMRKVQSVQLESKLLVTKIPFEVRATRITLESIADLSVIAGEAEVKLQWKTSDNPYITSYTIYRNAEAVYEVSNTEGAFIDKDVEEEVTYTYQVGVRFSTGVELKSELFSVKVMPLIKETVLLHNYPNPFNPETWIPYELAKDIDVTVDIYGVNGQRVRRLDLGFQSRGRYTSREKAAYWDGRNDFGEKTASGVYFYVFKAGEYTKTKKMVIVK